MSGFAIKVSLLYATGHMNLSAFSPFVVRLIDRCKLLVTDPYGFFEQTKTEVGMGEAFRVYAFLSAFSVLIGVFMNRLFINSSTLSAFSKATGILLPHSLESLQSPQLMWQLIFAVIGYLLGLLIVFIGAAMLHLWIMICGGKGTYAETFRLHVYRNIPVFLVSWIPVVGAFSWIYRVVLTIIGTHKIHGLSKRRAIVMFVIPYVLLVFMSMALFVMLFIILSQSMN